ncbi:MAG: L-threonylcarbamoyladenylate synthase [Sphaerochaetaceae bacterium]
MNHNIIDAADSSSFDRICSALSSGELVIMPCDTIYGIVGKVDESLIALRNVKGREETKPFIRLMTLEMARSFSCEPIGDDIVKLWPGPLTVIVDSAQEKTSVAIRVPDDPLLLSIIKKVGAPLYSSSVNISGEPSLHDFDSIAERFSDRVALCVKGNELQGTVASTIVDIRSVPYSLIRKGAQDISSLKLLKVENPLI